VLAAATIASLAIAAPVAPLVATAKQPTGCTTATGMVFMPNPVVTNGGSWAGLADNKDADSPLLDSLRVQVSLTGLDGSGFLHGQYAYIVTETGNPAYSTDCTFNYTRHDDRFEQVMAYYWVTLAQNYIQSLGFGSTLRPVNQESQDVRIDQWGQDNSYSWDKHDVLRFGKGGVDDAEDAEVILHEYGHAMMDSQQTPFGYGFSTEAGSIGEGFGDYWAATVSTTFAPTPDPACIADWDSVSYTSTVPHCLRRVDTTLHYPEDLNGKVHHDGQIWSAALWDIRKAVGSRTADTLILQGQFDEPNPTMPELARSTVAAAQQLYGAATAKKVTTAFQTRGIL
jgi:hypothetical protein